MMRESLLQWQCFQALKRFDSQTLNLLNALTLKPA